MTKPKTELHAWADAAVRRLIRRATRRAAVGLCVLALMEDEL